MKRKTKDDDQLSLFEVFEREVYETKAKPGEAPKPFVNNLTTAVDFVRARFEQNPEMTPEEYRRWIRILVESSIKRME